MPPSMGREAPDTARETYDGGAIPLSLLFLNRKTAVIFSQRKKAADCLSAVRRQDQPVLSYWLCS
jgi:hypothetical protein